MFMIGQRQVNFPAFYSAQPPVAIRLFNFEQTQILQAITGRLYCPNRPVTFAIIYCCNDTKLHIRPLQNSEPSEITLCSCKKVIMNSTHLAPNHMLPQWLSKRVMGLVKPHHHCLITWKQKTIICPSYLGFVILLTDNYRMVVSSWPCCIDLSTLNSSPIGYRFGQIWVEWEI